MCTMCACVCEALTSASSTTPWSPVQLSVFTADAAEVAFTAERAWPGCSSVSMVVLSPSGSLCFPSWSRRRRQVEDAEKPEDMTTERTRSLSNEPSSPGNGDIEEISTAENVQTNAQTNQRTSTGWEGLQNTQIQASPRSRRHQPAHTQKDAHQHAHSHTNHLQPTSTRPLDWSCARTLTSTHLSHQMSCVVGNGNGAGGGTGGGNESSRNESSRPGAAPWRSALISNMANLKHHGALNATDEVCVRACVRARRARMCQCV